VHARSSFARDICTQAHISRPAVASARLALTAHGDIRYTLPPDAGAGPGAAEGCDD